MPDRFVLMQSFYLITIIATEDWNSQTKSTTSALDRIRWVCVYWCVQICFLLFIFPFVNVCFCWTSVKRIKNEKIDCTFLVSVCARARERVNAIHRIESSRMIVCSIVRWFEWAIAEEKHSHAQNFNNNSYKHNNKRKWNANFVYSLEIIYSLTLIFHRCACVCMRLCVCVWQSVVFASPALFHAMVRFLCGHHSPYTQLHVGSTLLYGPTDVNYVMYTEIFVIDLYTHSKQRKTCIFHLFIFGLLVTDH